MAGDKQLVRTQLGGAVEVDRVDGLVGRQRDDFFDLLVDARIDDVLRADHVGLDAFDWIVFGGRNLLERGGMHDDIDARKRAVQTLAITDVADEVTATSPPRTSAASRIA